MSLRHFAALVLLVPVATWAAPNTKSQQVTGVFSDLGYSAQGGDMVGTEIFLVYAGGPYYVLLQCGAGRLGTPELVPAIVDYPSLRFSVPAETNTGCPIGDFVGTISSRGLKGAIPGRDWPGFLPRRKSFWQ